MVGPRRGPPNVIPSARRCPPTFDAANHAAHDRRRSAPLRGLAGLAHFFGLLIRKARCRCASEQYSAVLRCASNVFPQTRHLRTFIVTHIIYDSVTIVKSETGCSLRKCVITANRVSHYAPRLGEDRGAAMVPRALLRRAPIGPLTFVSGLRLTACRCSVRRL